MYSLSSEPRTPAKQLSSGSSFYPSSIDSVVGNALDELHLGLDDIDIAELDREMNDTASITSSIGSGPLVAFQSMTDPVSIPGSEIMPRHSFNSQSSTSPTSPLGQLGFFAQTQVKFRSVFIFVMVLL